MATKSQIRHPLIRGARSGHLVIFFATLVSLFLVSSGAQAQTLYTAEPIELSTVETFNAITGATSNLNFLQNADDPYALAVSGNTLFVSYDFPSNGSVCAYNATTGAQIGVAGSSLITALPGPIGLAVSGNTLFVLNNGAYPYEIGPVGGGSVGTYNASTGASISPSFISGLNSPTSFVISGNTLYVANLNGTVGTYNVTSGASMNPSFITGLANPGGLAISGNILYVANGADDGTVSTYNATTGVLISANFIMNTGTGTGYFGGLAVAGNILYVVGSGGGIGEYNATTGAAITLAYDSFYPTFGVETVAVSNTNPTIVVEQPAGTTLFSGGGTVNFGSVPTGAKTTQTFTIENSGITSLTLNTITFSGTNPGDFTVTAAPASPVAPSGTTTFTVQFSPQAVGNRSAILQIPSSDPATPTFTVNLTGSGIVASSPAIVVQQPAGVGLSNGAGAVNFGSAAIGADTTQTFTIKNSGTANLTLGTITFSGTNPGDFSVTASPASPVAPNGTTTFTVQFSPQATGSRSATLQIPSNDPVNGTFTVNLTGSATQAPAPTIYVVGSNTTVGAYNAVTGAPINASFITGLSTPTGLAVSGNTLYVVNFGNNTLGAYNATTGAVINASLITGLDQPSNLLVSGNTLFVSNEGSGAVGAYNATTGAVISASFISGLNVPSGLALSGNTLFVANQGGTTIGAYNATTGVVINASFITGLHAPGGILLSGSTLFVPNELGSSVGAYNAATGAPINASLISGLAEPLNLAISGNSLFVANYNGTISEYNATSDALINASFVTVSSIPTGMVIATTVPISPTIVVQQPAGVPLSNGASTVSFGTALVGENAVETFTIENAGTANLTPGAITFGGANPGEFSVTASPSSPVAPNGTTTFTVQFSPQASGNRSATLQIASNDPLTPSFSVNLAGSGFLANISSATNVLAYGATLNGTINPNGLSTTAYVQYGLTTSYGFTTSTQNVSSGTTNVPLSFNLTGLTLGTSYYYRLVVTNSAGTFYGPPQSFTTLSSYIVVEQPAGVALSSGGSAVNFGPVLPGYGATQTFTIENAGSANMTLGPLTLSGTNPGDFIVTASPSTPVASGGTTTFTVMFAPLALGSRSASLQIQYGGQFSGTFTVNLAGTGSAQQPLYVANESNNTVGEYGASSGTAVSGNFVTGLDDPTGLAVSANNLFVSNYDNGAVSEYNATTGAEINSGFITGLEQPTGLVISGNTLYVSNFGNGVVGAYNAATGAAINANFITGISGPWGLAISGNNLFVANYLSGTIGVYNATTGAVINGSFVTGLSAPIAIVISGNTLFVQNFGNGNSLGKYNATTGATINANFITGLIVPEGLAVSGNFLFVANATNNSVSEYDATTGATINANFVTGLDFPDSLAIANTIATSPTIAVQQPAGLTLFNGVSTVDFATTLVGASSTQTFTIANSGTASLTPGAITVGGPDPGDFSITASPSSPVAPNGTTTFTVQFSPQAGGNRSATLQIPSNDPVTPSFTVNLSASATLAATSAATSVLSNWATFNGTANPNGRATTAYFQYGPTNTYGFSTDIVSIGNGTSAVSVSANIAGLTNGTTYYYQLVVTNSEGTFYGTPQGFSPQAFTTASAVSPPQWHSRQLTTMANMASGSRTGAANTSLDQYYYKGTDDNVWCVYFDGTEWTQKALTGNANVSDWLTFQPNYGYIYYQGTNNQIWCVYFDGTEWQQAQQTSNGNIASDIVVDTVWNFFYYRGTDGNVWADYYNGTAWTQKALTTAANAAGSLSVDSTLHFIYYRGTDSNIWVCYFNGTSWVTQKLSTTANVGGAVTADADNVVYYSSSADNTAWAEYFNGTAWAQKQLVAGSSVASATALFAQYVTIYVNGSGQAETLYLNGSNWGSVVLGDGGSGLTEGLSINPANSWIFCGRNDGNVVIFYYQ